MKQTKRRMMPKLFMTLSAIMLSATLCLAGCGAADKSQTTTDGQGQDTELSDLAGEMQQELEEIKLLLDTLQEERAELADKIAAQSEQSAALSEQLTGLQSGILAVLDIDMSQGHVDNQLTVSVKSEYADRELTSADFEPVEVKEVEKSEESPQIYHITLVRKGDNNLLLAALQLYSLGFVDSVALVALS